MVGNALENLAGKTDPEAQVKPELQ